MEEQKPDLQTQSYWRFQRSDFFPEPSFQNWSSYRSALSQTPLRLRNRLLGRSTESAELGTVRLRSQHDMKRCLNWWDLTWFGIGSVIGAGIFVLTGQESRDHAGPSIVLSYIAAGISAMLSVFCYTEFAVEIPVAGGSFAYLRVELGDFAAFFAAANIILQAMLSKAAAARAWTSYLATLINKPPNSLRIRADNLAENYNLLDPIAVMVLMVTGTLAMLSTKKASWFNWVSSVVHVAVLLFIIGAGFAHADTENLTPFMPYGAKGVFQAAAIVYFAYGGFDSIAAMAEETKNPARDIPLGLLGSMSVITAIYCLMALALSMMQRYTDIDPNAAYSVAFKNVGMQWAQYIVALGALKGMTTVLLVGLIGKSRYITHIARSHILPPLFALVHPKTATPIYATLLIIFPSAIIGFFSGLQILSSLLSLSNLFVFMMTAVALLVRRYYVKGMSSKHDIVKLVIFLHLIIASSIATTIYWGLKPDGFIGYLITIPIWALATCGLQLFVPMYKVPKVWGVPLVPWLPSLSIAINIFLMGSLGGDAFVRFGVCCVIMLIYYVFVGVHATYDMAHEYGQSSEGEREEIVG